MFVNVGMWLERFVIVVMSLHRDFVPGAWGMYYPTVWDWATYIGTIGLFITLIFLFVRFLPAIAISEMKELVSRGNQSSRPFPPRAGDGGSLVMSTHAHEGEVEVGLYGLMVEFEDPGGNCSPPPARCSEAGYKKVDAYSPFAGPRGRRGDRRQDDPPLVDLRWRPDRRSDRVH